MVKFHPASNGTNGSSPATGGGVLNDGERMDKLKLVVEELAHRNKNLLAIVQAIANQTARSSVGLNHFQAQFAQRLQSLSRSADLLVRDDVPAALMTDVVRTQFEPFGEINGALIAATGPDVLLNPQAVQNIGLALHELATNATKYGALSVPEGKVTVTWSISPDDSGRDVFRLDWREFHGPPVVKPGHRGFGLVVLRSLTGGTFNGEVDHAFDPGGVTFSLEVPAASVVARGSAERGPKNGSDFGNGNDPVAVRSDSGLPVTAWMMSGGARAEVRPSPA